MDINDTEVIDRAIRAIFDSESLNQLSSYPAQAVIGNTVLFPPRKYKTTLSIRIEKNNITFRRCGQD